MSASSTLWVAVGCSCTNMDRLVRSSSSSSSLIAYPPAVSVPFFTEKWRPYSFIDKLLQNMALQLHTLCELPRAQALKKCDTFTRCLLDIKVKEVSEENMMRGRKV